MNKIRNTKYEAGGQNVFMCTWILHKLRKNQFTY